MESPRRDLSVGGVSAPGRPGAAFKLQLRFYRKVDPNPAPEIRAPKSGVTPSTQSGAGEGCVAAVKNESDLEKARKVETIMSTE